MLRSRLLQQLCAAALPRLSSLSNTARQAAIRSCGRTRTLPGPACGPVSAEPTWCQPVPCIDCNGACRALRRAEPKCLCNNKTLQFYYVFPESSSAWMLFRNVLADMVWVKCKNFCNALNPSSFSSINGLHHARHPTTHHPDQHGTIEQFGCTARHRDPSSRPGASPAIPLPAALAGLPARPGRAGNHGAHPIVGPCFAGSLGAVSTLTLFAAGTLASAGFATEDGSVDATPLVGSAVLGTMSVGVLAFSITEGVRNYRHRNGGHRNGTPPMTPTNNAHQAIV